ncbi:hypothetical protein RB195_000428 [Necator americanus]|uniref:Transposase n=1 Tax=Necator americanus TaxID=51031 RepID=A0ABR1DB55_NECAM
MVKKLGQWLPHALSDRNRQRRLDICTQLLSKSRRFDAIVTGDEKWLDTIVTADEKWVLYVNHTHKRACFELLPDNTTVTAEVYCAQLQRLADKIRKEHPKLDNVRLLHDNARPHIAKSTSQKILGLGWEHHLEEKRYDRVHLENDVRAFFVSMSKEFYAKGIRDLVRHWQKVVDVDGDYFVE